MIGKYFNTMDVVSNPVNKIAVNKYINREISWIEFNKRILMQSMRSDIPLFERIKFLGITSSNLDEFIMVRCGKLLSMVENGKGYMKQFDNMTFDNTLNTVKKDITEFKYSQAVVYSEILKELKSNNVVITKISDLTDDERKVADKIYYNKIEPLIISSSIDSTKDDIYREIKSKKIYIWAYAKESSNSARMLYFELNNDFYEYMYNLGKFGDDTVFITTEDLILSKIHEIYPEEVILSACSVRFLRSSHYEFDDTMDRAMTEKVEELLSTRESNEIISVEVGTVHNFGKKNNSKKLLSEFKSICDCKDFRWTTTMPLDISKLSKITEIYTEAYKHSYEPNIPQFTEEFVGHENMFDAIDSVGDTIIHHPFQSYKPIVQLIEDASVDKNVKIIQQTIYRASSIDSPIINALCHAAENGKTVRVLLELKARFDEGQNMEIREKLKQSGCIVVYCKSDIKTHAKCLIIVRLKGNNKIQYYSHIATGNYNEKTANFYTDLSYLSNDETVGLDLMSLFQKLATSYDPTNVVTDRLIISPRHLRPELENRIQKEIDNVINGDVGKIIFKVNSLSDKNIIDLLYKASAMGVKVHIICRGVCSMKPINKNISINSLVGRYLEHSRIYYFYNGGKDNTFISSADCLRRNLDRRIEILLPIKSKNCKNTVLTILNNYLEDTENTYRMDGNGIYSLVKSKGVNVHELFFTDAYDKYLSRSIPKFTKKKNK